VLVLTLVVAAQIAYLLGLQRQWRRGRPWSFWRLLALLAGTSMVLFAISPPVMLHAHQDLRGHMLQHLLLGMFAPLLLVLAAPVSLLLRTLPTAGARALVAVLRSGPLRLLAHPLTALLLNLGGMYLLYLTPLYAASLGSPALHWLVHWHFLAAGCLFTWAILAGPDPAPHAARAWVRLGVLFVAMAAHATLAKLMYGFGWPRGTHHGLEEIQAAAQLMYYGGDLAEMLLLGLLFARWGRRRGRAGRPTGGPVALPCVSK